MKKFVKSRIRPALWLAVAVSMLAVACKKDDEEVIRTFKVKVKLEYPEGYSPADNVSVTLRKANADNVDEAQTNAVGVAEFTVVAGVYEAASSETRVTSGIIAVLNGTKSNITVTDAWNSEDTVSMSLTESKTTQIVIKELYIGGCQKDDASGAFYNDKYVILYNNSTLQASLNGLTLAMTTPLNSNASNADYQEGVLFYETEGWIPAGYGLWTITSDVTLDAGKQIVIALNNAIDNTGSYSNSINFANSEYYCTYDPEVWNNTSFYSVSELIPTSHYLKAYAYGQGNAWPLSQLCPAFFVFIPEGVTAETIATDVSYSNYYNNTQSAAGHRKKIQTEWVLDAIEVFLKDNGNNKKRLTAAVDAGYVELRNAQGNTLYRNVNKEATEAIAENAGKLVYNYSLGTDGSTDPSEIDAEASLKNGAHIIYKDTNNSTNDFHQRSRASLRD